MNTERLERAANLAERLAQCVREAHTDAVTGGTQAEEILLFDAIERAMTLQSRLGRILRAVERKQ